MRAPAPQSTDDAHAALANTPLSAALFRRCRRERAHPPRAVHEEWRRRRATGIRVAVGTVATPRTPRVTPPAPWSVAQLACECRDERVLPGLHGQRRFVRPRLRGWRRMARARTRSVVANAWRRSSLDRRSAQDTCPAYVLLGSLFDCRVLREFFDGRALREQLVYEWSRDQWR